MSESKHTPGPLPLITIKCGDAYIITTAQGNHYATTYDPTASRLIASAPDLLAALEVINANAGESVEFIRRITSAAIAKAKGGGK